VRVGEELRQPDAADREVQTFVTCRGTVSLRAALPLALEIILVCDAAELDNLRCPVVIVFRERPDKPKLP
jgi:hypothetical protein